MLIFEIVWEGNVFFVFLVLVCAVCGAVLREIREQQRSQPVNQRITERTKLTFVLYICTFRRFVTVCRNAHLSYHLSRDATL